MVLLLSLVSSLSLRIGPTPLRSHGSVGSDLKVGTLLNLVVAEDVLVLFHHGGRVLFVFGEVLALHVTSEVDEGDAGASTLGTLALLVQDAGACPAVRVLV